MARTLFDSEYIHGLHDRGGESLMLDAGMPGWVLVTESIGCDPTDRNGTDYRDLRDRGLGVISRLNNGYYPSGTIPYSGLYADFARRCANFVAASPGCKIWLIGNEMNYTVERPPLPGARDAPPDQGPDGDPYYRGHANRFSALRAEATRDVRGDGPSTEPEPVRGVEQPGYETITPTLYALCYRQCRDAIHAVPGHEDDQVVVGAAAPWNNQTSYAGNASGDWVQYMTDILARLGPEGCDAIAIHTYTHGADSALIESEEKLSASGFQHLHYHFRTYQDFMAGIPDNMRHLPVYLTEADEDDPWADRHNDWIQRAHREINAWNGVDGHQQIRALIMYRWSRDDHWSMQDKHHVLDDFRAAVEIGVKWRKDAVVQPDPVAVPAWRPGDSVTAQVNVKLRRSPGHKAKPGDDVLDIVDAGTALQVLIGGPQQADGLRWWPVRHADPGDEVHEGWMADASADGTVLLAHTADAPPFEVGSPACVVAAANVNMRSEPGGDVIAVVPIGGWVTVTGPAVDAETHRWWPVRYVLPDASIVDGWMTEESDVGKLLLAGTGCIKTKGLSTLG